METSATIRPPKRPSATTTGPMSEKAQARLIRQKILEHEQYQEDLDALGMTPEELKTLQEPFAAVKAEFVDLDGQSWETATAREMLVNWHAEQATRARPVPLSPGGLRMRRHQPRRSLSAVVTPASSVQVIATAARADVFSDETVRARPAKVSATRDIVLPTVNDDDDPNDTTLLAPPDLSFLSCSGPVPSQPPEAPPKGRAVNPLAKQASPREVFSVDPPARTPLPTSVFTFACGSNPGTASPAHDSTLGALSKTVLSSSPTLNQEDAEIVLREFFPGTHIDSVGYVPRQGISKLRGPRPNVSRRAAAKPSSRTTSRQ